MSKMWYGVRPEVAVGPPSTVPSLITSRVSAMCVHAQCWMVKLSCQLLRYRVDVLSSKCSKVSYVYICATCTYVLE